MKYVSVIDAKEQLADLVQLLQDPREEVYLTFNGKPIVKMTPVTRNLPPVEENPKLRCAGIAKGKYKLPPDFDEQFVEMDAEILKMFSEGAA